MNILANGNRINDLLCEIATKNVQNNIIVVVNKLVLAAIVYYIWKERNLRIFRKEERNAEVLCNLIKDSVRYKMLALRVKNSKNVVNVAAN